MALEGIPSLNDVITALFFELSGPIRWVFGIIGAVISLYLLISIINLFLNIRRNKKLKKIESKIDELDRKVNIIFNRFEGSQKKKEKGSR